MLNFSLIVTAAVAVSVIAMGAVFIRKLGRVQRILDACVDLTRPRGRDEAEVKR